MSKPIKEALSRSITEAHLIVGKEKSSRKDIVTQYSQQPAATDNKTI